jgi:hypothetical protein
MVLAQIKPAVPKYWLIALAGLIWGVVGVMLCRLAYIWLSMIPWQQAMPMGALGAVIALVVYRYKFSKIARVNIDRLCMLEDKSCIFAFQAWYAYIIILVMIALGVALRHSPIPKPYLAVIYTAIGGALFLASFHFFRRLWVVLVLKQPCHPPVSKQ